MPLITSVVQNVFTGKVHHGPTYLKNIDGPNKHTNVIKVGRAMRTFIYRSKEEAMFQTHAIQNHPRSKVFFSQIPSQKVGNQQKIHKSEDHIFYCCPECSFKSNQTAFKIHALEKHPDSLALFMKDSDNGKSSKFVFSFHTQ